MTMKATLQAAISSGQINTKQELLERADVGADGKLTHPAD